MSVRVSINGFGRIGKNITRHLIDAGFLAGQEGDLELVAINDLGDIKSNSHLLKYDSIHGSIPNDVSHSDNEIIIDNFKEIYQQELINQNFDTSISLKQVTDYYNQYKDEFKLSKNIFKGRFIVVDRSAPKLINLNKWYKSNKESSLEDLNDYCQQFAKEYYLEDDKWQYFSIFNQKLPEYIIEESYFLENTKGVVFEDVNLRYYVFIKDYLINGSISPLEMEQEKIKNVLLNKNKIEYLKQLEDELYQNGLALKKIKIY